MTKLFLPIAVIATLSFTSCKKDQMCTCTDTSTEPGYVTSTSSRTYTDAKKADARAACLSRSYVANTYTYTTTCELK